MNEARRPDIAADLVRHAADVRCGGCHITAAFAAAGQSVSRPIETAAAATAWELALGAAMLKKYPYALFQAELLFGMLPRKRRRLTMMPYYFM